MKTTRRTLLQLAGGTVFVAAAPAILTRPARAADKRIAMIVKNLGNSYFDACANGAKEAAKELGGIEIIYTASAKPTAEEQIAVIDAQIAQKVDGIIVSANDADALVPVGKKAMERGIKVMSFDSAIAPAGRIVHLSASSTPLIGAKQVQMIAKTLGGKGEVAILSAASTMTNQNSWIEAMKEEWKKPEYKDMPLVATVYGDDQDDKSYREMQGLVKAYPNLKGVISPTTIGIRSGAKAIVDGGLTGKVFITGLGLPSEMKDYVLAGACDSFAIWNPVEYGYSSTMIMADILSGKDTAEGAKLSMGKKGETTVGKDGEASWASRSSSTRPTSKNSRKSSDLASLRLEEHDWSMTGCFSGHGRNRRVSTQFTGICRVSARFSPFPAFRRAFPACGRCTMSAFRCSRAASPRILGENGAGKSTIVKILTGIYRPSEGEIRVGGEPKSFPRRVMHGRPALPQSIRKR